MDTTFNWEPCAIMSQGVEAGTKAGTLGSRGRWLRRNIFLEVLDQLFLLVYHQRDNVS